MFLSPILFLGVSWVCEKMIDIGAEGDWELFVSDAPIIGQ